MDEHLLTPDELASAYLDDELDAPTRARVDADPALRARVEELRIVRDLVAAPPPPLAPGQRAVVLAAAMAAFDEQTEVAAPTAAPAPAPTAPTGPGNVVLLASRRRRVMGWVGAAAAAVVLLAGVALVLNRSDDDDATFADATAEQEAGESSLAAADAPLAAAEEDASRAGDDAVAGGAPAESAAPESPLPGGGADESTAAGSKEPGLPDLGPIDDAAALVAALDGLPVPPSDTEASDLSPASCQGIPGLPTATLVWQGTPAEVRVDGTTAPAVARVVDVASCSLLAEVPVA